MTDPDSSATDENALERMLRIATIEPGRRPEFYRLLLGSEVYFITSKRSPDGNVVPADRDLAIVECKSDDGTWVVPFFSSIAMARRGAPGEEVAVIMRAHELFEACPQRVLLLNPNCPIGRKFLPEEVERLLATGTVGYSKMEILDEEKSIIIEAETDPPAETIVALITLYSHTPDIDEAHLVRCRAPSHPERSTSLIALVGTGDMDRVLRESSDVIRDTYHGCSTIDLMIMLDTDQEIWTDIREVGMRFYDRLWGVRISEAFDSADH